MGQGLGIALLVLVSRFVAALVPWFGDQAAAAVTALTFTTRDYAYCLSGSVLIFAATRPGRRDWAAAAAFGALIGALYLRLPPELSPYSSAFAFPALLGLGALIAAAVRALAMRRKDEIVTVLVMAAPAAFWISARSALLLTPATLPHTHDPLLYAFDSTLGTQLSFQFGQFFYALPLPAAVAQRVYHALMLWLTALYALWWVQERRHRLDLLALCVGIGVIGMMLYHVLPAAGPAYQFGFSFPFDPPPLAPRLLNLPLSPPNAPRNAMPSLHLAWTLIIFWNSRGLGKLVRLAAGGILALTVLATLGLGEHYVIDLVAAVPFTLAMQAIFARQDGASLRLRAGCVALGVVMTAVWLLLLRYDIAAFLRFPFLSWTLIGLSTVLSLWAEHRLAAVRTPRPAVLDAPEWQQAAA